MPKAQSILYFLFFLLNTVFQSVVLKAYAQTLNKIKLERLILCFFLFILLFMMSDTNDFYSVENRQLQ